MPAPQPVCSTNPFSLTPDTTSVLTNSFIKVLGRPLGKMLGLDALNARYAKVHTPDEDASQGAFLSRARG